MCQLHASLACCQGLQKGKFSRQTRLHHDVCMQCCLGHVHTWILFHYIVCWARYCVLFVMMFYSMSDSDVIAKATCMLESGRVGIN